MNYIYQNEQVNTLACTSFECMYEILFFEGVMSGRRCMYNFPQFPFAHPTEISTTTNDADAC